MPILLRPEQQLLLDSARREVAPDAAARIGAALAGALDWAYLVELAEDHRIVPLVSRSLRQLAPERVPADALQYLSAGARAIGAHNLGHTARLLEILAELERRAIVAMPLKGPALAVQVYGDLSLRSFGDLDILIRQRDFPRAVETLDALGYHPGRPLNSPAEFAAYPRRYHDYKLFGPGQALMVELQWKVIQFPFSFPPDVEGWWERLESLRLGGREVRSLDPESLLLMLCVHGSKHLWERLSWICDVAELLRGHPELDWERLQARARTWGVARMLRLGLNLAHELLGAPLPASVGEEIARDPQIAPLTREVLGALFLLGGDSAAAEHIRPMFYLAMLERRRDRLRMSMRHAHSLLEPWRVLRTYGIGPLRRLLGPR